MQAIDGLKDNGAKKLVILEKQLLISIVPSS